MHLKTNIEMSFVHIAILAVCPLMFVIDKLNYALYFILATMASYFLAALVCWLFNKHFSRSVKVFVTAILSVFIVTLFDFVVEKYGFLDITDAVRVDGAFAVISTTILSIDIIYINTKAVSKNNYIWNILRAMLVFGVLSVIYSTTKEFLAYGTVYSKHVFTSFTGHVFCRTMPFNWLWMGLIAFVAEVIHRAIFKIITNRQIAYQKILKKVRNEKVFQYDTLRRKKLLAAEIETNYIDGEKVEEITDKQDKNEAVDADDISEKNDSEDDATDSKEEKEKKKRRKKLKVSKEAKVQKLFETKPTEDK